MIFKRNTVLVLFILMYSGRLSGQIQDNRDVEDRIESLSERGSDDADYSELEEKLNFYRKQPLDLNKATLEDLQVFFFLSPLQIAQFFKYRAENGRLMEVQELQVIELFDPETIRKLIPYVTVGEGKGTNAKYKRGHELTFTAGEVIQKPRGYLYSDSTGGAPYAGSKVHFLSRYRYHFDDHITAALTVEKDPGEKIFSDSRDLGFDFLSGNLSYKGNGKIRKLVLGDYSLQFGQGLTLWSGLGFGKGASVASAAKQHSGLKPSASANETMFLRGTAASIAIGRTIEITPFISVRKKDAGLGGADTLIAGITSLGQSGLHRTSSEIRNQNSVSESVFGACAEYSDKGFRSGAIIYRDCFNHPFLPGKYLYNQFDFAGSSLSNGSAYYNYNWQNMYLFGEVASTFRHGAAYVQGVLAALSKQVSAVLLYRNYQRDFYSFFGQGLSEGSAGTAEKGFYSGLVITPGSKTEISVYSDFFRFPWLRYGVDAPSSGYEIFSQLTHSPNKHLQLILRYKFKDKPENDDGTQTMHFLQDVTKQNIRAEADYGVGAFEFRNRAELEFYKKGQVREHGILVYQDLIFKPMRSRINGSLRFAIFDTDSFNSAIYAFENNLLYSYSIPVYQKTGTRFYINTRYKITRNAAVSARYAVSNYLNCEEIGSGNDKIEGHIKSDLNFQFHLQF